MCWNKEVSIATFALAIIGIIYLYKRNQPNDRWIALFAGVVAMIQLAEFFMWSDPTCGTINKYASIFALIILALEPLSNMVGAAYLSNSEHKTLLKYMLWAYVIFIAFTYFTQVYKKNITWCGVSNCSDLAASLETTTNNTTNQLVSGNACNLRWFFLDTIKPMTAIIWIIFLMVPLLAMTPSTQGISLFILGAATFMIARNTNVNVSGSIWCWLSIFMIYFKIFIG